MTVPSITDGDRRAVDRVLASGWLGSGPESTAFEDELAQHLHSDHVVVVSSCTAAIELMMDYLGLGPGHRVAVPAWTYVATAVPAARRGAQVVLVDSDPLTLALSPESLEGALAEGVDVVIPVHLGGVPVPRSIWELGDRHGARIIEDAAHAFGASDEHGPLRGVGSVGAAFSFHATKNLTCGEGGAIATTDPGLVDFVRAARVHGLSADSWQRERSGGWDMGDLEVPGRKANLSDVLAALGRSQLAGFAERQDRRRRRYDEYQRRIRAISGVRTVPGDRHTGSADHLLIAALDDGIDRDRVVDLLADAGISTGLHYRPLHHLTWFRANAHAAPGGLPVCDDMAERVLSLPLHAGLTEEEVGVVCDALQQAIDDA